MRYRIEQLLRSQASIRAHYRAGNLAAATKEFNENIAIELGAIDHRVSRCASRLARSFMQMVDDDIQQTPGA